MVAISCIACLGKDGGGEMESIWIRESLKSPFHKWNNTLARTHCIQKNGEKDYVKPSLE